VLAIAVHKAVVCTWPIAIFLKFYFLDNVLKIRVKFRVICGKGRGRRKGGGEERGFEKLSSYFQQSSVGNNVLLHSWSLKSCK